MSEEEEREFKLFKEKALVTVGLAENMMGGNKLSGIVNTLFAIIERQCRVMENAHSELITLYKSVEEFAQPRVLSHLIHIGQILERNDGKPEDTKPQKKG